MPQYRQEKVLDIGDLYDWERKKVADAYAEANHLAMNTPNDVMKLQKLGKAISDIFYKHGFLVNVDMSPCLLLVGNTGRTASPQVDLLARIEDPQNKREFDHDEKRFEVLDSKAKGEKFRGDKERVNKKPKKA